MNELYEILNGISKNARSFTKLQEKLKGEFLGNQVYIIEDSIYNVNFLFEKFILYNGTWTTDISINESDKVKESIFDNKLKDLMDRRIFEVMIHLVDTSKYMKSINN